MALFADKGKDHDEGSRSCISPLTAASLALHSDSVNTLAPYIPFSCSLVFQHEPEDSPACQIFPGFTPAWFLQHMELDYREPWHADPVFRRRSFVEMARVLNAQFPALRLGGDPERAVGSISQVRTCTLMAALFGQDIEYDAKTWPNNRGRPLTDSQADALVAPDFRKAPIFEDLMRQMDLIALEWGLVTGELNFQGVLNTAFRLRGEELFVDMELAPARAHRVLGVVCETMLGVIEAVYARQVKSGVTRDFFVTANCVVNMISAAQYREFVMPYDRKLSAHFPLFGIHNCAWRVDPYAPAYAEIRELGYLDFGFNSDFVLLKKLFPRTTLCAMYSPVALARDSEATVRAELQRLHDAVGRCKIIVADIEAGTPRERLLDFYRIASDVWGLPIGALVPPGAHLRFGA
jgi:hypothetical protein